MEIQVTDHPTFTPEGYCKITRVVAWVDHSGEVLDHDEESFFLNYNRPFEKPPTPPVITDEPPF